jgi:hypothetical protein
LKLRSSENEEKNCAFDRAEGFRVVGVKASNYLYLTLRAYQLMEAGMGKGLHILLSVHVTVYIDVFCSASLIYVLVYIVL